VAKAVVEWIGRKLYHVIEQRLERQRKKNQELGEEEKRISTSLIKRRLPYSNDAKERIREISFSRIWGEKKKEAGRLFEIKGKSVMTRMPSRKGEKRKLMKTFKKGEATLRRSRVGLKGRLLIEEEERRYVIYTNEEGKTL